MKTDHRGIGMTSQRTRERLVQRLQQQGIRDPTVLEIFRNLPRHLFVDEAMASRVYDDVSLPIGHGQTISKPYIVARMTEALNSKGTLDKVLEVGTGCGYQTAVLAKLCVQVFSIERIDALLVKTRQRLFDMDIHNVRYKHGDGGQGWPEYAPFDGILVAAAPAGIPSALLDQLAIDGRMVIPVGVSSEQELMMLERTKSGFEEHRLQAACFVPFRGGIG